MGGKLPIVSGREVARVLIRLGFALKSQKGSHMKFIRTSERGRQIIIVPLHKALRKGTLHTILKEVGLDVDALQSLR